MRPHEIMSIAESAYRHGQAYRDGKIMRSATRYYFRHPAWVGLPDYVINLPYEDHKFLESLYTHAFRAGLKGGCNV